MSADDVAARYGYSVDRAATTPVYALVPAFEDPSDGYARDLLARACLAGVVDYRVVPPSELAEPGYDPQTGESVFGEEIASQYGYPGLRPSTLPDTAVPDGVEIDDTTMAAMVACGERADARLGTPPVRPVMAVLVAGIDGAEADPAVIDAIGRWRDCMAPQGILDLPDGPQEMPPPSLQPAAVQDASGVFTDTPGVPLTERERQIAVADARCRASSGYDDAVFDARVHAELAAIGADLEGFEAARTGYAEYQKGVDAVIAELGG